MEKITPDLKEEQNQQPAEGSKKKPFGVMLVLTGISLYLANAVLSGVNAGGSTYLVINAIVILAAVKIYQGKNPVASKTSSAPVAATNPTPLWKSPLKVLLMVIGICLAIYVAAMVVMATAMSLAGHR